ncbi:hypothetical protein JNK62_02495 [bacterium]|nr:hypothetical protein [bacterium]
MTSVLLYSHLGLGDQIICHGIVRDYCTRFTHVTILAAPQTLASVSFMYRDIKNLEIIPCSHIEAPHFLARHKDKFDSIQKIGFELLNRTSGVSVERQFYALANVVFEKKWTSFQVQRDLIREQNLYNRIAPPKPYIFLHEDQERNFTIKRRRISTTLPHIAPNTGFTDNIFDYGKIIESASEVHVIDSSFMFLIDCMPYQTSGQTLFVHRYARPNSEWHLPTLRKKWKILGSSKMNLFQRIVRKIRR